MYVEIHIMYVWKFPLAEGKSRDVCNVCGILCDVYAEIDVLYVPMYV